MRGVSRRHTVPLVTWTELFSFCISQYVSHSVSLLLTSFAQTKIADIINKCSPYISQASWTCKLHTRAQMPDPCKLVASLWSLPIPKHLNITPPSKFVSTTLFQMYTFHKMCSLSRQNSALTDLQIYSFCQKSIAKLSSSISNWLLMYAESSKIWLSPKGQRHLWQFHFDGSMISIWGNKETWF